MLTKTQMVKDLKNLGICEGDVVLVHSSFKSLGELENGADTVVSAFFEAIGKEGTLVFPTLCSKDWEHVYENWHMDAPSDVGYLTNYFRKLDGALRSNQATHSVAAIGKMAEYITKTHGESGLRFGMYGDSAFSKDSPWDKLYELNCKIVFIGVKTSCCTMKHLAEHCYIDQALEAMKGHEKFEEMQDKLWHYSRWERQGIWPLTNSAVIEEKLANKGRVFKTTCGNANLTMVCAKEWIDEMFASYANHDFSMSFTDEDRVRVENWVKEAEEYGFKFVPTNK